MHCCLQTLASGSGLIFANACHCHDSSCPLPAPPAAAAPAEGDTPGNTTEPTLGNTADLANTGTPAAGAPSVDPNAAKEAAKRGE